MPNFNVRIVRLGHVAVSRKRCTLAACFDSDTRRKPYTIADGVAKPRTHYSDTLNRIAIPSNMYVWR
jgi:hypothetical protein